MCALNPPFTADDMNGLFRRVLKGQFNSIPSQYSMDMRMLIKTLLQVSPSSRPTTEQILSMPIVVKRIRKYFPETAHLFVPGLAASGGELTDAEAAAHRTSSSELLRTIKLSKNVFKLALPEPTYSQSQAN